MRIYLKNNPAKFHPDPIWNDGALGLLWTASFQQEEQKQQSSNMGPVPDPKLVHMIRSNKQLIKATTQTVKHTI